MTSTSSKLVSDLTVIIMAGGLGKRMKSELPKVLHHVGGVPMVVRVIREALPLNPKKILMVVGTYKDIIEKTLKEFDVLKYVEFIMQMPAMGTGHAIQCCQPYLEKHNKMIDKILVLSGDTPLVTNLLMKNMIDFEQVKMLATIRENPTGYGRVKTVNNKFDKIVEHKDCSKKELEITRVNCGMYAFRVELLVKYLKMLDNNNAQKEYYITDMMEIIKTNTKYDIEIFDLPQQRQWELTNVNDKIQLKYVNDLLKQIEEKLIPQVSNN